MSNMNHDTNNTSSDSNTYSADAHHQINTTALSTLIVVGLIFSLLIQLFYKLYRDHLKAQRNPGKSESAIDKDLITKVCL